ncbi:hypothetical protein BU14_0332s0021 [Porphyra umbilicalis]|uniref:Uncharacterized protein n=1 Tax=Porphyra umbilicalis TaxID=2786 RepID=A0A1X6NYQ5_PORUM|nr:hypothetical protein BU14_0332s0021 [Porphyra umbilicalis]|eukprot:OSX73670.1 hypothetical protein BU14_0332s0021 [Porphyra umbilicalis]
MMGRFLLPDRAVYCNSSLCFVPDRLFSHGAAPLPTTPPLLRSFLLCPHLFSPVSSPSSPLPLHGDHADLFGRLPLCVDSVTRLAPAPPAATRRRRGCRQRSLQRRFSFTNNTRHRWDYGVGAPRRRGAHGAGRHRRSDHPRCCCRCRTGMGRRGRSATPRMGTSSPPFSRSCFPPAL